MTATTTADGVDIAYEVTGAGPALVLVHGITESRHTWDPLVPDLASDHRVVAIDMRGHGESGLAPAYDAVSMAADVAAVLGAEGLTDPLVVGHSMGGVVVTAFASAHPCRGVVNVDQPVALGGFQELVRSVEPMLRGDGFGDVISGMFDSMQGPLPDDEVVRVTGLRRPVPEVVLGVWAPLLELSPAALQELVGALTGAVQVPYLALHGIDPGADYGPWLEQAIPTATLEVWDGTGHYPHLVQPRRFLERVRAFESTLA